MNNQMILDKNIRFNIGIEIEFMIEKFDHQLMIELHDVIYKHYHIKIENEVGLNQFEYKIANNINIDKVILEAIEIREFIKNEARKLGMQAIFDSKPYPNQPGNSMQINISAENLLGENLFAKNNHEESLYLLYAIGGLCKMMKSSMVIFVPYANGYSRFCKKNFAPTTVSWGGNNRTVALRVPTTCAKSRRIEHRVPASDADPRAVIDEIIDAIQYGWVSCIDPPKKIYGDASDGQYMLEPLPKTLEEAIRYRNSMS